MSTKARSATALTAEFTEDVLARIHGNKPVRRTLPEWGRLHVDRLLPFICVYRRPLDGPDPGTEALVLGEPLYLQAAGSEPLQKGLTGLLKAMAGIAREQIRLVPRARAVGLEGGGPRAG